MVVGAMLVTFGKSKLGAVVGTYGVIVHGVWARVSFGCSPLRSVVQAHGGLVLHTSCSVRYSSSPHKVRLRLLHALHSYVYAEGGQDVMVTMLVMMEDVVVGVAG